MKRLDPGRSCCSTSRTSSTGWEEQQHIVKPLLQVSGLEVEFPTSRGPFRAVDKVSFEVMPGERLGLIGESGSGKSTIALALMRMIRPPGRIAGGRVLLEGNNGQSVDLL